VPTQEHLLRMLDAFLPYKDHAPTRLLAGQLAG
jgi:hypothetical protein